jgi:hypothetical protein
MPMTPQFEFTVFHKDSPESIFFTRELTKVQARSYDVKFPTLKSRTFIPVGDGGLSPADEVGIFETYTSFGVAMWVTDYATDFPRADVAGTETPYKVYSLGSSYDFTMQEVRKAQQTGKPLEQRRANAARLAIENKIDQVLFAGDSGRTLYGLTNQPNGLDYAVPNGAAGTATWSTKTPDEIMADMSGMRRKVTQTTLGIEDIDTLLLPQSRYEYIRDARCTTFDATTILQMWQRNNPGVNVQPWQKLETAASGGGVLMVGYRNSPDYLLGVVSQEFEQFPPQTIGMVSRTPCHARTGGVIAYYPATIVTADLF